MTEETAGGYTALSTKGVASLLSDTLWRALTFPITYLLVAILVATAVMQIRYVNRALQRFDSTQVIPIQFVLFTLSVIVGSAILYRDFKSATGDRIGKFIGGCILTFLGVYLITSGRASADDDANEDLLDDEENAIGLVDEEAYEDNMADDQGGQKSRQGSKSIKIDDHGLLKGSRRSSKQRSISGSLSPQTPHRPPSRTPSTSSPTSSQESGSESPILVAPWRSSDGVAAPSNRPRALAESASSPLLPSEAHRSEPSTPHTNGQQSPVPWTPGRPSTRSRQSIARLAPGPLMSPLSAGLSAVVADEIRKSVDPPLSRRRPRLSGLRKSRSQRATMGSSDDVPTDPSPLKAVQLPGEVVDTERPDIGRSKSVSAKLGDFFHLKRERSKGKSHERIGAGED